MELFEKTRLKAGYYFLARDNSRRSRKALYTDFSKVKKIGIVWDASKPDDFLQISRFQQKMLERGIEVQVMAYYSGKELPDHLTAIRYLTCIRRNELNFFYKPLTPEVEKFVAEKFDVLIDININRRFPLVYLTTLSLARFKVGIYDNKSYPENFELVMELRNPVIIEQYLDEVIRYLEMIKSE